MRKFLIIAGIIELVVLIPGTALAAFLGCHGYAAGEMGTMVGIFSSAVLFFLVPYVVLRVLIVCGLYRKKRWAALVCLRHPDFRNPGNTNP